MLMYLEGAPIVYRSTMHKTVALSVMKAESIITSSRLELRLHMTLNQIVNMQLI